MELQPITVNKPKEIEPSPLILQDTTNQTIFNIFEFVGNLQVENFTIIESHLKNDPIACALQASILDILADLIEKYGDDDDLILGVNTSLAQLIDALEETEKSFYGNQQVRAARQELYALRGGFEHSGGNELMLFVCDKDNFLTGDKTYSVQLQNLLMYQFQKFRNRNIPAYLGTCWALTDPNHLKWFRQLGATILAMTVHTLPFFKTSEQQLAYLAANPIAATNKINAFSTVFNAHADIGVKENNGEESMALPIPINIAFCTRMAFLEVGGNISGNLGVGLDIKKPLVRYHLTPQEARKAFNKEGVIIITDSFLRGRTTTCIGGNKPVYGDYAGMDAYLSIVKSLYEYSIDVIDVTWTKEVAKNLRIMVKNYFNSLFDLNTGRVVLYKPVNEKTIKIDQDPVTGELRITANIELPGFVDGASIMIDPIMPSTSEEED